MSVRASGRLSAGAVVAVALCGFDATARADGAEQRVFAVTVDGRAAGTFTMSSRTTDGRETVEVVAAVRVRALVGKYAYDLRAVEVWKSDTLVSLDATANDDGKKTRGRAADKPGVLTSTGWRPPARRDGPSDATLIEVEDGSQATARVEPLPAARVTVSGRPVEAKRFRVKGAGTDAEWWFDDADRPVRQEMTWDGHKVVLTLIAVTTR